MTRSVRAACRALARVGALGLLLACGRPAAYALDGSLMVEPRTLQSKKGLRVEAEAGTLMVRENRSAPGSRAIPIRFLRLKSRAAVPRGPLFYLAGGPGNRGVSDDSRTIDFWAPFLEISDVVLIDQRGVSDPDLVWSWDGPPPLAFFASGDSALRHVAEMNRRAAVAIRARGRGPRRVASRAGRGAGVAARVLVRHPPRVRLSASLR